jgi:hypothetical protein
MDRQMPRWDRLGSKTSGRARLLPEQGGRGLYRGTLAEVLLRLIADRMRQRAGILDDLGEVARVDEPAPVGDRIRLSASLAGLEPPPSRCPLTGLLGAIINGRL